MLWPSNSQLSTGLFMSLFAIVIMSNTGQSFRKLIAYIALQLFVYFGSIMIHEFAHYWLGRKFSLEATIRFKPNAQVEIQMSKNFWQARAIALIGPLAGGLFASLALWMVIQLMDNSKLLIVIALGIAASHLVMLWPSQADGQVLFKLRKESL